MKRILFRFFKRLGIVTLILALLMAVVFGFLLKSYYIPVAPFLLLFFFLFTFITYSYQIRTAERGLGKFTRASMVVSMLRLFVYVGLTALLIALEKENAATLVIMIGSLYIVFTVFEVREVSQFVRKPEPGAGKTNPGGNIDKLP